MSLFVSALALALSTPTQAAPAPAALAAVDPARVQIDQMLNETFPAALAADPAFREMEDCPGISKAMTDLVEKFIGKEASK